MESLQDNKYKQFSQFLLSIAGILLIPFSIYLLVTGRFSSIFSFKGIGFILATETSFVIIASLTNYLNSWLNALISLPYILYVTKRYPNCSLEHDPQSIIVGGVIGTMLSSVYIPMAYCISVTIYNFMY